MTYPEDDKPLEKPIAQKIGDAGWLAPDGSYYPCDHIGSDMFSMHHVRKARQIVLSFHADRFEKLEFGDNSQMLLQELGYIRVDIEDLSFTCIPTQAQIDTLFDLYRGPKRFFPTEEVRKVLAWRGLKFLSKPEDDVADMWFKYVPADQWPPEMADYDIQARVDRMLNSEW